MGPRRVLRKDEHIGEKVNYANDDRLERRLRRRFGVIRFTNNEGALSSSCIQKRKTDCLHEDDVADPDYAKFLKNARWVEKSIVLDFVGKDGKCRTIMYEVHGELSDELKHTTPKISKDAPPEAVVNEEERVPTKSSRSESWKRKRPLADDRVKEKENELHNIQGGNNVKRRQVFNEGKDYRSKLRNHSHNEGKRSVTEKELKDNVVQPYPRRTSGSSGQKESLEVPSSPSAKRGKKTKNETPDESYVSFLKCLNDVDGVLVYRPRVGKEIRYEDETSTNSDPSGVSSDSDSIIVTDCADVLNDGKENPFVSSKMVYTLDCQRNGSENFLFRKMLIKTLCRPYDSTEYKNLLAKASERKPVEQHRELRSGPKGYPVVEKLGKSYLDHHKDFADKIDSVSRDCRKVLNLLRGFFYWLENLLKDGAFKPWKDEACLKVMPLS